MSLPCCLLAVTLLWVSASPLAAQTTTATPPAAYRKAYAALKTAEWEIDRHKDKLSALQKYRKALGLYEKVQSEHPDWHPKIIAYRVTQCRREITSLAQELDGGSK